LAIVGNRVLAALYFSDALAEVNLNYPASQAVLLPLGPAVDLGQDLVRRGEMLWNDGTMCFQQWVSCSTCHPDARVDALNWDLMNDGIGNPKNTRSMLLGMQPGRTMALGVRESVPSAVRAGITHIEFAIRPEQDAKAIDAYLRSLRPMPSPHLINGRLSPAAERGKKIFFSNNVGCAQCHPAPTYSDGKSHNVGSVGEYDKITDKFYTPSLLETWRTAPYLHDGRYSTLKDLMIHGKHGNMGGNLDRLTNRQIDDLVEFIQSL
jgi:cytochrome c peroxidase